MPETPLYPDDSFDEQGTDPAVTAIAGAYRIVADGFVYPEEIDREAYVERARTEVVPAVAEDVDRETADRLASFLDEYESVGVDEFVETLELEPDCPPYLGHHEFDEPETCRDIADADRNQYMVELNGIYEHFGFEIGDELPDYLPAMAEFCWLTLPDRDDPVRDEFLDGTATLLPGARQAFADAGTPYADLLAAFERLVRFDLEELAPPAETANADDGKWDAGTASDADATSHPAPQSEEPEANPPDDAVPGTIRGGDQ